jgi:hypothetical protein
MAECYNFTKLDYGYICCGDITLSSSLVLKCQGKALLPLVVSFHSIIVSGASSVSQTLY